MTGLSDAAWDLLSRTRNAFYMGNHVDCQREARLLIDKRNPSLQVRFWFPSTVSRVRSVIPKTIDMYLMFVPCAEHARGLLLSLAYIARRI